jgi:hypothetical protein
MESNLETSQIRQNVKSSLLRSIISYYQAEEYAKIQKEKNINSAMINSPLMIQIDVPNPRTYYQKEFAKIKGKIENENIKKEDFSQNVSYAARKEIETYFACFDPQDPNYKHFWNIKYSIGEPEGMEAYTPVWANTRRSVDSFQRGMNGDGIQYYSYGVGYFCFALVDMFTIEGGVAAAGGVKSMGLVKPPTGIYNPAYFPTVRGGYGVFGKNGLQIGSYKIEAMYQNDPLKGGGGGTVFSIKEHGRIGGGNMFRLDYGVHNSQFAYWHYHYRFFYNGQKYGNTQIGHSLFKRLNQ